MRQCLMCKKRCIEHYGICAECERSNEKHRLMEADLTGCNAVVTGGRINIGYAVCLRLLRNGARVIAVTRFPYDALKRYSQEKDFDSFKDRLYICGFDLKRADRIYELIDFIRDTFPEGLDILVNNAAQTIRKAPSYYNALAAGEERLRIELSSELPASLTAIADSKGSELIPAQNNAAILYETPDHNSWVAKSDEISAAELLEVQLINVTAPFILTGQLKAHMAKSSRKNRFIINVSSAFI